MRRLEGIDRLPWEQLLDSKASVVGQYLLIYPTRYTHVLNGGPAAVRSPATGGSARDVECDR